MLIRYNPFRPNGIVPPHMFCGREDEMTIVRQCLYQTLHENPQNFLFEGERGIGKSSLLHYIKKQAAGEFSNEQFPINFKFLVLSIELTDSMTYGMILHSVASELKVQLMARYDTKTLFNVGWDFFNEMESLWY